MHYLNIKSLLYTVILVFGACDSPKTPIEDLSMGNRKVFNLILDYLFDENLTNPNTFRILGSDCLSCENFFSYHFNKPNLKKYHGYVTINFQHKPSTITQNFIVDFYFLNEEMTRYQSLPHESSSWLTRLDNRQTPLDGYRYMTELSIIKINNAIQYYWMGNK